MSENGLLKKVFHPNRVSAYGGAAAATGVVLLTTPSTMPYGVTLVAAGYFCDHVDGMVARDYSMKTLEGAKLDPLVDKVKNVLVGGYVAGSDFMNGGIALPIAMLLNFGVDYFSQKERGSLLDQVKDSFRAVLNPESCHKDVEVDSKLRANIYGKIKAGVQAGVNLTYIFSELINNYSDQTNADGFTRGLAAALVLSAGLGIKGILDRRKV